VRFPDLTQIEKAFPSGDKIRSVYAFVRDILREDVKPIKFILGVCLSLFICLSNPPSTPLIYPSYRTLAIRRLCSFVFGGLTHFSPPPPGPTSVQPATARPESIRSGGARSHPRRTGARTLLSSPPPIRRRCPEPCVLLSPFSFFISASLIDLILPTPTPTPEKRTELIRWF
jgi:hypothetical protein